MTAATWHDFYYGSWQWPWALLVLPFAWGIYRLVAGPSPGRGPLTGFLRLWVPLFLLETMLDPVATGPLAKLLPWPNSAAFVGILFVLLGDFRVYWLVFRGVAPEGPGGRSAGLAAGFTVLVPLFAWGTASLLPRLLGPLPDQTLWLVHELAFTGVAAWLALAYLPSRVADAPRLRFLRAVLGYVAAYYALWAASDVLVLSGVDPGWLVRCVPNQLYYAAFVPFVAWQAEKAWR